MSRGGWCVALVIGLVLAGCGARRSSLLLERHARGPLDEALAIGRAVAWRLEPVAQSQTVGDVEVRVNHASWEFQKHFFSNKQLFGEFAGATPYFPEHLVFYVEIANRGGERITVDPTRFVLVDDRGNQHPVVTVEHVTAYADYRAPVGTTTRGVLQEARPGYFGLSLPVGKLVARPQGRFARLKQAALQSGVLHPGVVHDGLVGFWNPSADVRHVQLVLIGIKTGFDTQDLPRRALEFAFEFDLAPE